MDFIPLIINALWLIGAAVLAYFSYQLMQKYLSTQEQLAYHQLQKEKKSQTLSLRVQAYERLILLCERISMMQLVKRLHTSGATVSDLQMALIIALQQEFEHNTTQQIYVSEGLWQILKVTKDSSINLINAAADTLQPHADSGQLVGLLLQFTNDPNNNFAQKAQEAVRQEAAVLVLG